MTVVANTIAFLVPEPKPPQTVAAPNPQASSFDPDAAARRLAAAISRGDEDAFRQLYDAYHQRLIRFALALGGNDEYLAQDIVQAVFVTAAKKLGRVETEAHLWNWLARVARQKISKDRRQKQPPAILVSFTDLPETLVTVEADSLLERYLDNALLLLSSEERQTIEWFYFDGLSHKLIAEQLATTPKAVSSQLERARARLRSLVKQKLSHES